MGFTINKEITTVLSYEDVALIAVAIGWYNEQCKDKKDDVVLHGIKLVNRLGVELYDCEQ